ncbi:MAG TPA: formate dehydrogenase accessory protein FdhE [Candidatus Binatia bacterium]|jgi:FdhE protein
MTVSVETSLDDLGRQRPEWEPWLAVVREVVEELGDPRWDVFVPDVAKAPESKIPLLAAATITCDKKAVGEWTARLLRTAFKSGTTEMATLEGAAASADALALLKASLCQDGASLSETAARFGADADAFQAVASQLAVPFLHACSRRWASSLPISWMEGYCPVCGAWPAFAEVRGIDRNRYFRCGRCASEWRMLGLVCPFCGMDDHEQLARLVPEKDGTTRVVEACKRCLGYVKTFMRLQASPAVRVILDDLANVDLDMAALEQGYKRPPGAGYALDVAVVEKATASDRFFSWRK